MRRSTGVALVAIGIGLAVAGGSLHRLDVELSMVGNELLWKATLVAAIVSVTYGLYALTVGVIDRTAASKRRSHTVRNLLRLALGAAAAIAVLGLVTERWLGVLFSLGIVGFAVTFALQQPLFSLIGWLYITLKQPYGVGDRVKIEDAKGDVIDVDFLVTTLWEINGELVSSNQPSGRVVTLPNSTVLSTQVYNYSWEEFPFVWNEIALQVAYETDLEFASRELAAVADEYLGDEMEANVERYREVLSETPVELEVRDRPSVNVVQQESWVELRLRYLVHPKESQRVKNELYKRGLERFNDHPDRIGFPHGRSR